MRAALDGNAAAGAMLEAFGIEMTSAEGTCASCGAEAMLGESLAFLRAPGTVLRCRRCEAILLVLVTVRGVTCVDLRGLASLAERRSV
jgi:Family of unknown function (DUF6510)